MLGETRTLNFGKEKINLNLEQRNIKERNSRYSAHEFSFRGKKASQKGDEGLQQKTEKSAITKYN